MRIYFECFESLQEIYEAMFNETLYRRIQELEISAEHPQIEEQDFIGDAHLETWTLTDLWYPDYPATVKVWRDPSGAIAKLEIETASDYKYVLTNEVSVYSGPANGFMQQALLPDFQAIYDPESRVITWVGRSKETNLGEYLESREFYGWTLMSRWKRLQEAESRYFAS